MARPKRHRRPLSRRPSLELVQALAYIDRETQRRRNAAAMRAVAGAGPARLPRLPIKVADGAPNSTKPQALATPGASTTSTHRGGLSGCSNQSA
jgi:hypothetical protein